MEYVEGARDLATYADDERLDLAARIALFRAVCAAVHHAHEKGVIHRDLKPGNILVDATGQPKVIDYGVARAIDHERAESMRTEAGFLLGTLQYLSPEQLSSGSDDVDVRSDVYALGVILYELVAGRPPYEWRAARSPKSSPGSAASRRARLHRTGATFRADRLDRLARAVQGARAALRLGGRARAEDLGRHVRDEPVSAGPPTAAYRLRKLVAATSSP